MKTQSTDADLYEGERFRQMLEVQVERAHRGRRPYTILACVPQQLPGEGVALVVAAGAWLAPGLVRNSDLAGLLHPEVVTIGAPETSAPGAQALAHRLQSELSLRSGLRHGVRWEAGFACLPEDGSTPQELLQAAIEAARTRRQRLARSAIATLPATDTRCRQSFGG